MDEGTEAWKSDLSQVSELGSVLEPLLTSDLFQCVFAQSPSFLPRTSGGGAQGATGGSLSSGVRLGLNKSPQVLVEKVRPEALLGPGWD